MKIDNPPSRWRGIDVLRGISILAVVLLHIDIRIPIMESPLGSHLPRAVHAAFFRSGYYGVKMFFVISGFLITANILRRWGSLESIDWKAFYRFRFARIAPCLVALLAILSLLHFLNLEGFVIRPEKTTLARALFAALTFHLNQFEIAVGYLPASWDVLWSLSVEEVFYLAYPWICLYASRRWILVVLGLALVITGPFARTVWAANEMAQDYGYFTGFDCIALGCASAIASHLKSAWKSQWILWLGITLMLPILVFRSVGGKLHLGRMGLDVTVLALGTALVLFMANRQESARWWTAPLEWFGRNSYEIYLTHGFVMIWGAQAFRALGANFNMAPWWHIGMVTASGLLGWLVAKYYSEPLNRRLRGR